MCIRLLGLLLVAAAGVPGEEQARAATDDETSQTRYDWGVAYYMSYDNNLDRYAQPILAGIRAGIESDNLVIAVQADFSDTNGMQRYVMTSEGIVLTSVDSEDSADADQVLAYLRWFVSTFPCRKYMFTFLNHGGKVDEMCYDHRPQTEGKHWISGQDLGRELRAFRAEGTLPLELLFLQQCGRGSIENLYSFRATADYVMSSPVTVGAPNTYYPHLHRWLAHHRDATGESIARVIAANDQDFSIYTCARGDRLSELATRFDDVIVAFLRRKRLRRPDIPSVIYAGGRETVVDLRAYLQTLAAVNDVGATEGMAFCQWLERELFTSVRFKTTNRRLETSHCGLSLFVPARAEETERYGYLELYNECRLSALWAGLGRESHSP